MSKSALLISRRFLFYQTDTVFRRREDGNGGNTAFSVPVMPDGAVAQYTPAAMFLQFSLIHNHHPRGKPADQPQIMCDKQIRNPLRFL